MPYTIEKEGSCFKVINKKTGKVFAKCTTKAKAELQLNLLRGVEHGFVPTGKKAKNESLNEEVWTAKKDKNKNTFNVYIDGKYFANIGAETEERAIKLAKQEYREYYSKNECKQSNDRAGLKDFDETKLDMPKSKKKKKEVKESNIDKLLEKLIQKNTLCENLQRFIFEAFSNSVITQLQQKYGEDSLQLIKQFDDLRTANRKEVKGIDIFNFKSKDDLEKFLNSIQTSKSKQDKVKKTEGSELVFENDLVQVYLIKTKNASCIYGSNTKWCITSKEAKHWETYTDKGITFYFIIRKSAKNDSYDKVAVAKYPESLGGVFEAYDAQDRKIDENKVFKMFNLKPSIFKEWIDENVKFITVGDKKIKYTEEDGMKIYNNIDISSLNLSKLPDFN